MIKTFCSQPAQKRYGYSNGDEQIFTFVREVLHQSRNLVGPYHFCGIKPKEFDFVHQTVSHQEVYVD